MTREVLNKTIVVKVGSDSITKNGKPDEEVARSIMQQIACLREHGYEVLLVTSGAVALGRAFFGLEKTPDESIETKKSCAIQGQPEVMKLWRDCSPAGHGVGQILVDRQALSHGQYDSKVIDDIGNTSGLYGTIQRFRELQSSSKRRTTAVFNWNDPCHGEELDKLGDNDDLAGLLAREFGNHISKKRHADALVLLTDVDGVRMQFDHPDSVIREIFAPDIHDINEYSDRFRRTDLVIGPTQDRHNGSGEIVTKIRVALHAALHGTESTIANAREERALERRIIERKLVGTVCRTHGRIRLP